MAKFKITSENIEDKWHYVVKVANRMCFDSNKLAQNRQRNQISDSESD